jgi:hypothetical protein
MSQSAASTQAAAPPWSTIAAHMAVLMRSVGDISGDLHRRVPSNDLWQFKALIDTGEDILMTTIVAVQAIDELGKRATEIRPLPQGDYSPDDPHARGSRHLADLVARRGMGRTLPT